MSALAPRRVAIMQGRLVPPTPGRFQCFPRDAWADEFAHAARAGLDGIEWIYDAWGEADNPLATDAGVASMRALADRAGVRVASVCADYFMDRPLLQGDAAERAARLERLVWLLERCARAGIERAVLPFVDASRIEGARGIAEAAAVLRQALPASERTGVELHLETDLGPADFAALLAALPHPAVRVNYDSGNSASLGFRPADEFGAYGARVGSVHIKDRVLGGTTVPLGAGAADFGALREALAAAGYAGDLVLQVARGTPGDEVAWSRRNTAAVRAWCRGEAMA